MNAPDSLEAFRAHLQPLLASIARLNPTARTDADAIAALERALSDEFPLEGAWCEALRGGFERGVAHGWLCTRGDDNARFSRVIKPSDDVRGYSVDVVNLEGEALRHRHPAGEITIGFAAPGTDPAAVRFDGRGPGFVFLGPGSEHTPSVTGGRMLLLYVLPGGEVQWL